MNDYEVDSTEAMNKAVEGAKVLIMKESGHEASPLHIALVRYGFVSGAAFTAEYNLNLNRTIHE